MNEKKQAPIEVYAFLIIVCSFFCFFHVDAYIPTNPVGIETNISPLTTNSDQVEVTVSNGWIAWSDNRDRMFHSWTWDLHLYNIVTGNESIIRAPGDTTEPSYPTMDGQWIVWQSGNSIDTYDIQLYDTVLNEYSIIAFDVKGDFQPIYGPRPEISGNHIVWKEQTDYDVYNIFLYDIPSKSSAIIATNVTGYPLPKISENRIIWHTFNSDTGLYDIVLYNISESPIILISGIFDLPTPSIDKNTIAWQAINFSRMDSFDIAYIPDISISANPLLAASDVALNFDPYPNPDVSNGNITWQDWRNGNLDIFLYNISRDELMQINTDLNDQRDPKISENRIVWIDMRNGFRSDVFMYTLGSTDVCPVASYATNATIGGSPFIIQFTDTSHPLPVTWDWEFGDGNSSRDQNPLYAYFNQGTYTVNLIVSTEACRSGVSIPNLVHVGTPPDAGFSVMPVSGFAPLDVSFTDRSSGSPNEWLWDFGDGTTSISQNTTHTYASGGSYNVSLSVNNSFGTDNLSKPNYISVLERTGSTVSMSIDGLYVDGSQGATFNSTMLTNSTLTNGNTILWFIPPPENGISEMTLIADEGFTQMGGTITGNLTGVSFRSEDIPLTGFSLEIGSDCSMSYALNSSVYPINAQIATAKWEGYIPSDYDYFLQTIYHAGFAGIVGIAYEVQFQKTNLNIPHNATLYFNVNSSWVETHGTNNRTWVLRIGDDMTGEVLPTTYSHSDTNLDYFVADSPHGLSKFALTGLHGTGNPLQIVVLIVQQLFGGGSSSDNDSCTPVCTWEKNGYAYSSCNPNDCPKSSTSTGISISTGSSSSTPSPTPTLPLASVGSIQLPVGSDGILDDSVEVQTDDLHGTVSFFKDTKITYENGTPVTNISIRRLGSGEIPITSEAGAFKGIAYELSPGGGIFDPPAVLTFEVPGELWSDSIRYSFKAFNQTKMGWESVSTTSNSTLHTLIVQVSRSSVIGLFGYDLPTTAPTTETTATPPITTTPLSVLPGVLAICVSLIWWVRRRR